jgi:hypothetical protein
VKKSLTGKTGIPDKDKISNPTENTRKIKIPENLDELVDPAPPSLSTAPVIVKFQTWQIGQTAGRWFHGTSLLVHGT